MLDPENAVAWLQAATAASAAGDAAGVESALRRAAGARGSTLHRNAVHGPIATALPDTASETDRLRAHDLALVTVAAWVLPAVRVATGWCSPPPADPDRRALCGDLARLFAERGETLLELRIGASLASRLDPDSREAAAWSRRADALLHPAAGPGSPERPGDCVGEERARAHASRVGAVGEVRAHAERLAEAGLGVDDAAAQMRERWRAERRARDAAASAAREPTDR